MATPANGQGTSARDRLPPQNLEAEQATVGAILIDRDAVARVSELLTTDDFYREAHRRVYDVAVHLFDQGQEIDLVTVAEELRRREHLDSVGGPLYLTQLIESELNLVRLEGAYSKRHPEVQAAQSQLEVNERAFSALLDGDSPTGQYLRAALSRATNVSEDQIWSHEAKRVALQRRFEALTELHDDKQSRLAHLRAFEGDLLERENARLDLRELCAELQKSERDLDLLTHLTPQVLQLFRSPAQAAPIQRRPSHFGVLVLLFSAILSVGVGYLVDWIDPRVRDVPTLRRRSGVPCLAVLPRFRSGQIGQLQSESSGRSLEAFHGLASQVSVRLGGQRVLLVTGTDDGVGTRFVSEHLARATARLGLRTLLIDGDLANPVQQLRVGVTVTPGLSNWVC